MTSLILKSKDFRIGMIVSWLGSQRDDKREYFIVLAVTKSHDITTVTYRAYSPGYGYDAIKVPYYSSAELLGCRIDRHYQQWDHKWIFHFY